MSLLIQNSYDVILPRELLDGSLFFFVTIDRPLILDRLGSLLLGRGTYIIVGGLNDPVQTSLNFVFSTNMAKKNIQIKTHWLEKNYHNSFPKQTNNLKRIKTKLITV